MFKKTISTIENFHISCTDSLIHEMEILLDQPDDIIWKYYQKFFLKLWIDDLKFDLSLDGIDELFENPLMYGGDRKYRDRYLKTHLLYHNCLDLPTTKKYVDFVMCFLFVQLRDYDEVEKWNNKIFDDFCKDYKQPNPEILLNYYHCQGEIEKSRKNWNKYFELRKKELNLLIELKGRTSLFVVNKFFEVGEECYYVGGENNAIYYLTQYLVLWDLVEDNEEQKNACIKMLMKIEENGQF